MMKADKKRRTVRVLMVEDNDMDVLLATEILTESEDIFYDVFPVKDGVEAVKFLRRMNNYKDAFKPDVIILDLNLPVMNGFDFLKEIKADSKLKKIPICILTTSSSNLDKEKVRKFDLDCYMTKPLDLERFEETFFGPKPTASRQCSRPHNA